MNGYKFVSSVGAGALALIAYAIPVLTALSWVYMWGAFIQWLLIIFSLFELVMLWSMAMEIAEDER